MLAIRLMRTGKIHDPHYRIVVQEKRSKLNGKAIDTIGHYHPTQATKLLVIDKEKAQSWLSKGAQPSDTVTNLFVKEGILDESRKVRHFYTPKPKEETAEAAAPAPAEEVAPEEAEEAPATEEIAEPAAEETPSTEEEKAPEADTAA